MSPPRRKQTARIRPRSEVVVAVLVGVGIVVGTVLLIWLLRPKSADGTPGTGGLFTRQPRFIILRTTSIPSFVSVAAERLSKISADASTSMASQAFGT